MKGYQKNSAEARLGALGERWVDAWCTREGGCRLEISGLGKDALVKTPDGKLVSPDRLGVFPGEGTYFYDIKTKAGAVLYALTTTLRQGIDLPHWNAYREVSTRFNIPGALALVQLRDDRSVNVLNPRLLWGRLDDLAMSVQIHHRPHPEFPHGGAWWDVGKFEDKGPLPVDELAIPVTPLALHSWERPAPAPPAKAAVPTTGCLLMLPQPGGGHRPCGRPVQHNSMFFCQDHSA